MLTRNATIEDIPQISGLQQKYHVASISEQDKQDGFVTTLFTHEQFAELITTENGITVACDGDQIIAYAMAASWDFWSKWPLFQFMIADLGNTTYQGVALSTENSYQYGPVCIDKAYRGMGVLEAVFHASARQMSSRFPYLITFINQLNPRSFAAHTRKLGMDVIKPFSFNNNQYYELGFQTANALPQTEAQTESNGLN